MSIQLLPPQRSAIGDEIISLDDMPFKIAYELKRWLLNNKRQYFYTANGEATYYQDYTEFIINQAKEKTTKAAKRKKTL